MNADLTAYVREALSRGLAPEAIRAHLRSARWRPEEIETALAAWAEGGDGPPVPRRRLSLSAREAFQHLVLFATLFIFTFNVAALLFMLVDTRLRDAAFADYGALQTLRWSTAGALTALPIFLWMHRLIERSLRREPEKSGSGIRRWLTYLTLFVAALVLIGNFITLVSALLGGELSARFALKSLVVFAIAGTVFGYYLGGLRREEADGGVPRWVSWLGRAGVVAAALAIVGGLFSGGAPARVRLRMLDLNRTRDLEQLERAVAGYRSDGVVPASLDELHTLGLTFPERDALGMPYGYQRVDSVTYRLSAVFSTADTLGPNGEIIDRRWRHGTGLQWFTRRVPRLTRIPR